MAKPKTPIRYFVCLDTTVVIDVLKLIWEGKEPKEWTDFKALINSKAATLLIPQVVLLELEKHVHLWEDGLLKATATLETTFPDADLSDFLRAWRNKKKARHWSKVDEIRLWLASGEKIEYSIEIAHLAKQRLIAGNYPPNRRAKDRSGNRNEQEQEQATKGDEWLRDQDCAIIESLIAYFDDHLGGKQLAFVTTDKGFGPVTPQGIGSFDETFRRGLPTSQIFTKLERVIQFVTKAEVVVPLTKDEVEEIEFEETISELLDRAVEHQILSVRPADPPLGFDYGQGAQHAANFDAFMRRDYDRRMRNMANYNPPPGFLGPPPDQPPDDTSGS
jgi:hypothetical protein